MSIEIKQLIIKSNVSEDFDGADIVSEENVFGRENTALKNEVLNECRRLIRDALYEKGLR